MDFISYSLINKAIQSAVSGISSMSVDGTTLIIDTNDGQRFKVDFPTPKDGISIIDVEVNTNNEVVCTMSDGSTISAGIIKTIKGKDGVIPTFSIGDVTTLDSNQKATVNITGTSANPILNFGIPKGADGNGLDVEVTDEKVKLNSSTAAKYLEELIDNSTIVIDTNKNVIKAINLDGLETTTATLNLIKNLDKDIMLYLNSVSNPMTFKGVVTDDDALTAITDAESGDTYIVQSSSSNSDRTMTFVYNGSDFVAMAETTIEVRDFAINPIDLSTEVTGILPKEKIDDAIARLADILTKDMYKGSTDGVVKSADTLEGLTCTIEQLNTAIANSHEHLNKDVLDKIISNGLGNRLLADDGTYKEFLFLSSTAPTNIYTLWVDNTNENNLVLKIFDGNEWIPITGTSNNTENFKLEISKEDNNAIINKSDGIFVEDKTSDIEKLKTDLAPIKKYQKYVNTELDYFNAYGDKANNVYELSKNVEYNLLNYLEHFDGNMTIIDDSYITLKANKTYYLSVFSQGYSGLQANTFIKTEAGDVINRQWVSSSFNGNLSYIYTPKENINIKFTIKPSTAGKFLTYGSYLNIHEITHDITIDPVEHINTQNGLEDTPVGHIIAHMGTIVPKHYLICDGTEYNIADYPYLAEHIKTDFGSYGFFGGDGEATFAVPDLRGEFLRGTGTANRNTGSGEDVGEHQEPTEHSNIYVTDYGKSLLVGIDDTTAQTGNNIAQNKDKETRPSKYGYSYFSGNITTNAKISMGYTSRPTNTSVLYCIKYEPTYFMNIYGLRTEKVLFEGELVAGNVTLTDSVENYNKLEIKVCSSTTNNAKMSHVIDVNDIEYGLGADFCGSFLITDTTLGSVLYFHFNDTKTFTIDYNANGENNIKVYKIIGIKYGTTTEGTPPSSSPCPTYTDEEINNAINDMVSQINTQDI